MWRLHWRRIQRSKSGQSILHKHANESCGVLSATDIAELCLNVLNEHELRHRHYKQQQNLEQAAKFKLNRRCLHLKLAIAIHWHPCSVTRVRWQSQERPICFVKFIAIVAKHFPCPKCGRAKFKIIQWLR